MGLIFLALYFSFYFIGGGFQDWGFHPTFCFSKQGRSMAHTPRGRTLGLQSLSDLIFWQPRPFIHSSVPRMAPDLGDTPGNEEA